MSFFAVSEAELDLGIDFAYKKFGCTIMRRNLLKVSDRVLMLRQTEQLEIPQAIREALTYFHLTGDRREWYKAALGKMFSSRAHPMHKGKAAKKPPKPVRIPARPIPTVLEGNQFAFGIMRRDLKPSKERINEPERKA